MWQRGTAYSQTHPIDMELSGRLTKRINAALGGMGCELAWPIKKKKRDEGWWNSLTWERLNWSSTVRDANSHQS